jgi:hypothetical protein
MMSFPEFIEVLLLLQLLYYGTKQENPFNFPHFLPLAALCKNNNKFKGTGPRRIKLLKFITRK